MCFHLWPGPTASDRHAQISSASGALLHASQVSVAGQRNLREFIWDWSCPRFVRIERIAVTIALPSIQLINVKGPQRFRSDFKFWRSHVNSSREMEIRFPKVTRCKIYSYLIYL